MAVFTVSNLNHTARCDNLLCKEPLHNLFSKSGCGRPLAVCPRCRELYILDTTFPLSDDPFVNFLKAKLDGLKWEWIKIEEYCLKEASPKD